MKVFLSAFLLFLFVFCWAQSGAAPFESEAVRANAEAAAQPLNGEGVSPAGEDKAYLPDPGDKTGEFKARSSQTLEDFLKYQEELWLQEREEAAVRGESAAPVSLERPSILSEDKTKDKIVRKDVSSSVSSGGAKTVVKKEKEPGASDIEIDAVLPENKAEDTPLKGYENWAALLKGLVFSLVLAAAVWFLSKYQ